MIQLYVQLNTQNAELFNKQNTRSKYILILQVTLTVDLYI